MSDVAVAEPIAELGEPPACGWLCFHCGDYFPPTDEGLADARDHFGVFMHSMPGCAIKLYANDRRLLRRIRALEAQLVRYQDEDTDLHRQVWAMESNHIDAMQREEEKGYARGLADGRKEGTK